MTTHNKRLAGILLAIIFILLVPAGAMLFTGEVKWTLFDFAIAGGLLLGAALTYEFFARRIRSQANRVAAGVVIAVVLLVVWLELAVGIFGTTWSGS